jgi:hypothetical protein
MEKDEILNKGQCKDKDECEEQFKTKAFHIGWISVSVVVVFLIFWRGVHDEPINDLMMIIAAQLSAVAFYQYINMPEKKSYLVLGFLSAISFLYALLTLLRQYQVF